MKERPAALKACKHIFDKMDETVCDRFCIEKKLSYSELDDYYEQHPRQQLMDIPSALRKVFERRPDSGDEDVSMTAKITEKRGPASRYPYAKTKGGPPKATPSTEGFPRGCIFCGSSDHLSYLCHYPIAKRREIVTERGLCFNCLRKGCKGVKDCQFDTFCKTCKGIDPKRSKHSSWICNYSDNPYTRAIQNATKTTPKEPKQEPTIKKEAEASTGEEKKIPPRPRFNRPRNDGKFSPTQVAKIVAALANLQDANDDPSDSISAVVEDVEMKEPGNEETAPTS
jgi:hypothetical protein